MLVTPLHAYQKNLLSIDSLNLIANMHASKVSQSVTPSYRAGTLVKFPVKAVRATSLVLVDENGKPLKQGSHVDILPGNKKAIIGYDGALFLESLKPHNLLHR